MSLNTVECRLGIVGYRPDLVGCRSHLVGYRSYIVGYRLDIVGYLSYRVFLLVGYRWVSSYIGGHGFQGFR